MFSEMHTEAFAEAPEALQEEIAAMLCRIWPRTDDKSKPVHPPELNARSFFCRVDGQLAAYAAVVQKTIFHAGARFCFAGLCCVATLPGYRKLGLGTNIVRTATDWMAAQGQLDFGIFTCAPELTRFYCRAGEWEIKPELILTGNEKPNSLNSKMLKTNVLQRLFSAHARKHEMYLARGVINLDFPDDEFI